MEEHPCTVHFCSILVFSCTAAGYNQHAECVALLLVRGADPNMTNKVGLSARQDVSDPFFLTLPTLQARGNDVLKVYKIWESTKSKEKAVAELQKKYPSMCASLLLLTLTSL